MQASWRRKYHLAFDSARFTQRPLVHEDAVWLTSLFTCVELSKLRPWSGPSEETALSYVLRRESWGHGVATEAAGRLLRNAIEAPMPDTVMALIMAENRASAPMLEKLGLRPGENADTSNWPHLQYFTITHPFHKSSASDRRT